MQRLHREAFFVYTVIVGLAIREALVRAGSHIFLPSTVEPWKAHLEALRLVIFLLGIICFYCGAASFFDRVYLNSETADRYKAKIYGLDFASGLVHFIIFFGWSLTIADHARLKWGTSYFMGFMGAVLLYDLVWAAVNIKQDTLEEIKLWTFMTAITFFLSIVTFFVARAWSENDVTAEEASFIVVGLYLLGDSTELFSGRPFFSEIIKRLLPRNQS